jgi:hypothetical protein
MARGMISPRAKLVPVSMKPCILTLITQALLFGTVADAQTFQDDLASFSAGKVSRYSTKGHPKAGKVELSVDYPSSWKAGESDVPDSIQNLGRQFGATSYAFVITASRQDRTIVDVSNRELKDFFRMKDWGQNLAPPPAVVHAQSSTRFEGRPAGMLDFSQTIVKDGIPLRVRCWGVVFIHDGRFVQALGTVTGFDWNTQDLNAKFEQARPLFQAMLDSLILHNAWGTEAPSGSPFHRTPAAAESESLDQSLVRLISDKRAWLVVIVAMPAILIWRRVRRNAARLQPDPESVEPLTTAAIPEPDLPEPAGEPATLPSVSPLPPPLPPRTPKLSDTR